MTTLPKSRVVSAPAPPAKPIAKKKKPTEAAKATVALSGPAQLPMTREPEEAVRVITFSRKLLREAAAKAGEKQQAKRPPIKLNPEEELQRVVLLLASNFVAKRAVTAAREAAILPEAAATLELQVPQAPSAWVTVPLPKSTMTRVEPVGWPTQLHGPQ